MGKLWDQSMTSTVLNREDAIQKTQQGVDIGPGLKISSVDQADDTCLLSNDIFRLFDILHLTMNYCKQYNVELCAAKTKLVMISPTNQPVQIPINPISIYGQKIAPSHQAEHVGVIRSHAYTDMEKVDFCPQANFQG